MYPIQNQGIYYQKVEFFACALVKQATKKTFERVPRHEYAWYKKIVMQSAIRNGNDHERIAGRTMSPINPKKRQRAIWMWHTARMVRFNGFIWLIHSLIHENETRNSAILARGADYLYVLTLYMYICKYTCTCSTVI